MISKELLSIVFGHEITNVLIISNSYISISKVAKKQTLTTTSFNIYELAHRCKEWAFNSGFSITVYKTLGYTTYTAEIHCDEGTIVILDSLSTEPEAVLKACEWVLGTLENKSDKEEL